MERFKLGKSAARWAVALSALTFVAGPVTAAIWQATANEETAASAASVAALTGQLKATVTQTAGTLASQTVSDAEAQAAYVAALEGTIIASGSSPQVAIDALVATRDEMKAAGSLSATAEAAIDQVLARIRETVADEAPAATGAEDGTPAFGTPPVSGSGGGGPDYSTT
ncbi:MAG: hypothetical protein A2352_03020 [Caulobacterales bacterium RIFOXYB1_FULL_67_16]|nr:MAG: hypothetical protein A2352_03020 [Caulobacterales bacterium RIFOXYB1_FULL_67_16]